MTNWVQWHEEYSNPNSSLARRLDVVRQRISQALDRSPAGEIKVISMCAGDGRDLLGVLQSHPRAGDVAGRLVELDQRLAKQAKALAPTSIEILCGDAGNSNAYDGAVPANLLLCCGVFGNITDNDIQNTIDSWPMLCASEATVIWTRGSFEPDRREKIRYWVRRAGFEELSFDGANEKYSVGVSKMVRAGKPYRRGVYFFSFVSKSKK